MKKRIAFISEHASPLAILGSIDSGGQNVYVGELAKQLTEVGYEVDVFTRKDNPKLPEVIHWVPGLRVIHIEAGPSEFIEKEALLPHTKAFSANMAAFIRRERRSYGLIHANFFMSAMVASDLKALMGIPYVVTFHALGYVRRLHQGAMDRFPAERISIEQRIVRDADHLIAECPRDKDDLVDYYGASLEKITIIPCGFNPQEFHPVDRQLARMILNMDPAEKILLQLGRMVPRKGVDNVINALSHLHHQGIVARLVIVGGNSEHPDPSNDPEIGRLTACARTAGVAEMVLFAGRQKRDMLKFYYAASDVFITTPWYEPFGITPLEAMACATPVIGSAVGGIQYTILDGKTGFLVPPKEPEILSSRIARILTDRRLADRMGKKGLKRVHTSFTWKKVALQMGRLYEQIMSPYYSEAENRTQKISIIETAFEKTVETLVASKQLLAIPIFNAASLISNCITKHHNVFILGNGRSAGQGMLFAEDLIHRLDGVKALPLINDIAERELRFSHIAHYEDHFAERIKKGGKKGDVIICLCSGIICRDILDAMKLASQKRMNCIAIVKEGAVNSSPYIHIRLPVPTCLERQVQEINTHILNTLYELIDLNLFSRNGHSKTTLPRGTGDSLVTNWLSEAKI